MTDRPEPGDDREPASPGWARPAGPPDAAPGPLSSGWAIEQPPAAVPAPVVQQGWGPVSPPPHSGAGAPGGAPTGPPGYSPPWMSGPPPMKPGVIPLRPLGVGEILDGAISAIRAKPRIMLGLSAVVAVITQLLTLPVTWLLLHDVGDISFTDSTGTGAGSSTEADLGFTASALTAVGLQVLITLVATLLLTGVLTVVLSKAVLGQDIEAADAWAQTRPRIGALIGVTLLVVAIELGVLVVTVGPGLLLLATGAPGAVVAVVLVLGIVAAVVIGVYLYTAFALAPAAIVLERQSVRKSLRRSHALVRGAWWRTFAILLLVNVLARVLANIVGLPFSILGIGVAWLQGSSDNLNPYGVLPLLVTAVGSILASTIAWPFTAVSTALLYVDRRIRREALDISLARAAGLTPTGTSATPGTPLSPPAPGYGASSYGGPTPPYSG